MMQASNQKSSKVLHTLAVAANKKAAFYPAQALFGTLDSTELIKLIFISLGFFAFSLLLWELGIRKYQSAGG